ncbi:MAG: CehA/McbA family metallohydrolase [Clostridia bacterium]|nr:CehA/McbA family metallohydrolase [Clostridia bacterium]
MSGRSTIKSDGIWYKGNIHAHTRISDGTLSPEALARAYQEQGYDFIAITDHRVYGRHETLCRDDFIVLPGVELDVLVQEKNALCHHIIGLGLPGKNKLSHGQSIFYDTDTSVDQLIAYLKSNGNICIYAHPNWSHVFPERLAGMDGLLGLEIFNYACEVHAATGFSDAWYDRLLWDGQKLFCVASDDTHHDQTDIGGGFIFVKANELSHQAIMDSIVAGCFHASEGPLIDLFYVEDEKAFVSCSPCRSIGLLSNSYPGMAINDETGNLTEGFFTLKGHERYVRAVCTDSNGRRAWSQPIWL